MIEQPLFVFMRSNIGYLDVPVSLQQVGGFQTDLSNDVSRIDRLSRVNAQADATYFGTPGAGNTCSRQACSSTDAATTWTRA